MKKGLILEGGGMRGIYTAGVLDFFLEHDIYFDGVIGVSAGACHGCSYLSKQKGRAFAISTDYLNDKRYCSFESLFKTGDLFGKEFVYHDIPEKLNIFDHITYDNNPTKMIAVITNVITGKPEYHILDDLNTKIDTLRASASLPFLSNLVNINDNYYLDGGISDSVPLDYMLSEGYEKIVVVLTQAKGYRKSKNKLSLLASIKYHKYPKLVASIQNRHLMYNKTMDKIDELERLGKIEVIRPLTKIEVGRIEKDVGKLKEAYKDGYNDAKNKLLEINEFLLI